MAGLPGNVGRYAYDRDTQAVGIVHLGIGAFHRAHQAVYTDLAMSAGDRDWAICGVSLRSRTVRDQLMPQDGIYSVTERQESDATTTLIGSVRSVLVAGDDGAAVADVLARPTTKIVTLTVTEKGYHPALGGGLATNSADIAGDLAPAAPNRTIYGCLADGLARRRAAGLPGLTLISCDNLSGNGTLLASHLMQFLDQTDPPLRTWFEAECAVPSTMVDRIVPASTSAQIDAVESQLGVRDEAAVITEPFTQWVIEDSFAGPRPRWEIAGAQFVDDVRPFELAKLRMLNAAHSALAYVGLARGYTYVHEAVADPGISNLVDRIMLHEAAPTIPRSPGLDLVSYAARLRVRFSNAALGHRLDQIAMDGSQKITQRWLPTLQFQKLRGVQCEALLISLAAWIRHVRNVAANDPLGERLAALWRDEGDVGIAVALFGALGLFSREWIATEKDLAVLTRLVKQT